MSAQGKADQVVKKGGQVVDGRIRHAQDSPRGQRQGQLTLRCRRHLPLIGSEAKSPGTLQNKVLLLYVRSILSAAIFISVTIIFHKYTPVIR